MGMKGFHDDGRARQAGALRSRGEIELGGTERGWNEGGGTSDGQGWLRIRLENKDASAVRVERRIPYR